LNWPSSYR